MILRYSIIAIAAALFPFASAADDAGNDKRPNILIILADDLGFSDLGCYGGEIRTPALDSLAKGGLRFTRSYNSSRCCPSRASLLTGLYPHQAGIGRFVGNGKLPGYRGRLTDRCMTIAEVLETAGYATYACGKWHVNDPPPTQRGFREFYGFIHGYAVDSWDANMMIRLPKGRKAKDYPPGKYFASDAITDHALEFLQTAGETGKPWLLYTAYQAPHFPVQAPPELSATYDAIYQRGWDELRAERLKRMKKLGIFTNDLDLPPRSPIDNIKVADRLGSNTKDGQNPAWASLTPDRRKDLARRMSVYAAMVENMDTNIGRLVKSIKKRRQLENTLIIFLSDNGACAEWEPFGFDLNPDDYKNKPAGYGINGGTPGKPNRLHQGDDLAIMGGHGSLFSYGSAWANLSNTPLWLYKHYAHEGGIRTPMIIHWPERIPKGGEIRRQVTHIMDIMPTCIELAGAKYPTQFRGNEILPLEGQSLINIIDRKKTSQRTLIFEHERNAALIEGDWKLVGQKVIRPRGVAKDGKWQLFDISKDPTEQNDLSRRHPERMARMIKTIEQEGRRTLVFPAP